MNSLLFPHAKLEPVLDPQFKPAALANRAFRAAAQATGRPVNTRLALEQADGSVFHHRTDFSRRTMRWPSTIISTRTVVKFCSGRAAVSACMSMARGVGRTAETAFREQPFRPVRRGFDGPARL